MTFLTAHLPWAGVNGESSALPPPGSHLLVSDTLTAPARFVLYHLIGAALARKQRVVWVDFRNEGRGSVETVLKKLGTALPAHGSAFTHISPSAASASSSQASPALFDENDTPSLKPTYESIAPLLSTPSEQGSGPLILLDGLLELCWLGFTPPDIGRFVRGLLGRCRATGGILVSTIHADHLPLTSSFPPVADRPSKELLDRLVRLEGTWWRISGLASGRSGDVHGEISSHNLIQSEEGAKAADVPRSQPLQYRLEANGVKVFVKGTGRGFL